MIEHAIYLEANAKPVRQMPYRLHPERLKVVDSEISQLLREGIIEPSDSPWAAPIVMVPKADGSLRMCTDFRKLNSVTVPESFPMPRMESLLDKLGGARYLTKLDMTKGYYNIPIVAEHVPFTGFVTPHGHYQWKYMAFGLRGAPSTFSKLMRKLFMGMEDFCDAYLDDVIIFSRTWDNHLNDLSQVLRKIEVAALRLNVTKCVFANAKVDFLGHHVGLNELQPRIQKVEALLNFPTPKNKKQVQSLLGLASYYRKFLPHFADITIPLNNLIRKNKLFVWTEEAERAFVELKSRMASRPILC